MSVFQMLMVCGTILSFFQYVSTSPTVQINDSQIIGKQKNSSGHEVNQYLGIPYAQPPVGPLRFQKPQPVQNYTPVFEAFTNPPACPQYSTQPFPWYIKSSKKSEDCLYLNIWTPVDARPTNKKAVFYWIHGGGYRYGSMRNKVHNGTALASLGDIIVVTVNYRLGTFGFFTSDTDDAPGNIGLWDILEGLKWVNQNIEAFGGDSNRITIAGESAGAFSVGYLTISPMSRGLYTRLITESGSALTRFLDVGTPNNVLAQQLAENVGCANDTYLLTQHPKEVVQCLKGVDFVTLTRADFELDPLSSVSFLPKWGDDFLPENPRIAVQKMNFICKDLLTGNNKDEGGTSVTEADPDVYGFFGEKNPRINITFARNRTQKRFGSLPGSQSILDYYLPANLTDPKVIRHQAYTENGDIMITCGDVYYAEKCAEQNQNVYSYVFAHRPSVTPYAKWMGVAHFEEVQFVFGEPILDPKKYQPSEVSLSRQMVDIWSHFVKHGKPNIPWPLYSRKKPYFKYLGPNNVTEKNGVGPHRKNCNFLRPFFNEF